MLDFHAVNNLDISRVDNVEKAPEKVRALMRSLARNVSTEFESAAANLKKLVQRVNVDKMREPSFLMILTATEYAYKREDGIYVVPLGCLRH